MNDAMKRALNDERHGMQTRPKSSWELRTEACWRLSERRLDHRDTTRR